MLITFTDRLDSSAQSYYYYGGYRILLKLNWHDITLIAGDKSPQS